MPAGRPPAPAIAWAIRCVAVRTRDSPERLDQAYRRLMGQAPRGEPPSAPDRPTAQVDAASTTAPRR